MIRSLIAVIAVMSLYLTTFGRTLYVDASAALGGLGLVKTRAFNTISAAVTAASSGDTISIEAGIYMEKVVIEGKNLTLNGAGRDLTIIDAGKLGSVLSLTGAGCKGSRINSIGIVNGSAETGAGLFVGDGVDDVGFLDGKIMDCVSSGDGAAVKGSAWIVRSLIGRCWSTGSECAVFKGVKGLFCDVIIGCGRGATSSSDSWSTWGKGYSPLFDIDAEVKVVNCTFSNNEGRLMKAQKASVSNVKLRNCAIFGVLSNRLRQNAMDLQYCFSSLGGVLTNDKNNIGGDDPSTHSGETWPSTHYQVVNPFADWRLLSGSDLIGKGSSTYLGIDWIPEKYVGKDYYGNNIDTSATLSMGAAQVVVNPPDGKAFGKLLFKISATGAENVCASNLWINGYRAVSPGNLSGAPNPTTANGISFVSVDGGHSETIEFRCPNEDERGEFSVYGFMSSCENNSSYNGVNHYPNLHERFTFVVPAASATGLEIAQSLKKAASVKWVSPSGNDNNDGSKDKPYKTLQKAHNGSSAYGVVYAAQGVYNEGVSQGAADSDNVNTTSNRLYMTKEVCFIAQKGPESTSIEGYQPTAADSDYKGCGAGGVRCVQANGGLNCAVVGFKLCKGATDCDPVRQQKSGKTGDSNARGNFGGSAVQGYVWNKNDGGKIQVIDCIIEDNASYYGTVYDAIAKNCVIRNNRITCKDSTLEDPGVTAANGTAGTAAKFFGCLIENNEEVEIWVVNGCSYDCTFSGNGKYTYSSSTYLYDAFYTTTDSRPSGVSSCVSVGESDVKDLARGDWRPVLNSVLLPNASLADTQNPDYINYGTISMDGLDYSADDSLRHIIGAYRDLSGDALGRRHWYVDANNGGDDNDGTTPNTARKTLAAVMELVRYGDTVHAARGTYDQGTMNSTLRLINSGDTESIPSRVVVPKGVNLIADEGHENTMIYGAYTKGDNNMGNDSVRGVYLEGDNLLEGFTIGQCSTKCPKTGDTGFHEYSCGAGVVAPRANNARTSTIRNCKMTGCYARSGSAVWGGVCERCEILDSHCTSDGTTCHALLDNCLVRSHRESDNCSLLRNYYGVYNCTVYARQVSGDSDFFPANDSAVIVNSILHVERFNKQATLMRATNCIVRDSGNSELPFTIDSSCKGIIHEGAGSGLLDILDGRTFRLKAGSVAINGGDMDSFNLRKSDIDLGGGLRVYNGTVDIGCFEYDFRDSIDSRLRSVDATEDVVKTEQSAKIVKLAHGAEVKVVLPDVPLHYKLNFSVVGAGTLKVMDGDKKELKSYTSQGEYEYTVEEAKGQTLYFLYDGGGDDVSAESNYALLNPFVGYLGLQLIFN